MPRVFLGNFDFEHELAAGHRWQAGAALQRINAELACAWLAVAASEDTLCSQAAIDPEFLRIWSETTGFLPMISPAVDVSSRGGEFVPWGWSERVVEWGNARGLVCRHPPLKIVREVNCRLFSHDLETEWDVGLRDLKVIRSLKELKQHLDQTKIVRWVLKARFGMSGRERLLGRGKEFPAASLGWLESRLKRDKVVIFEPWVENVAEAGLQWEIPQNGPPQFLGLTPLLTDAQGCYRGNRLEAEPTEVGPEWQSSVVIARRAAERIQELGYFGPLGIDAMQYRDATGRLCFRPLQDINARWTMGRLTLGWRRLLKFKECGTWLHWSRGHAENTNQSSVELGELQADLPADCHIWKTSPDSIAGRSSRLMTLLIAAPDAVSRSIAESTLLRAIDERVG